VRMREHVPGPGARVASSRGERGEQALAGQVESPDGLGAGLAQFGGRVTGRSPQLAPEGGLPEVEDALACVAVPGAVALAIARRGSRDDGRRLELPLCLTGRGRGGASGAGEGEADEHEARGGTAASGVKRRPRGISSIGSPLASGLGRGLAEVRESPASVVGRARLAARLGTAPSLTCFRGVAPARRLAAPMARNLLREVVVETFWIGSGGRQRARSSIGSGVSGTLG